MTETIVACATPAGFSSIAVLRSSGEQAVAFLEQIFKRSDNTQCFAPNRITYGKILDPKTNEVIDTGMASVFFQPNSYTGEDVVELSCHGNPLIVDRIVSILIDLGARLAGPGEFTRRALLNCKIDLLQAEAVADIVRANCDLARKTAVLQYEGRLSERVNGVKSQIVDLLKSIEASIDFPEEEETDLENTTLLDRVNGILADIYDLLGSADTGVKIKEGYRVVIAGKPNVGKSTLFNRLLGYERVIVHETPGTTRDCVEEGLEIGGVFVILTDTAGFMPGASGVDQIASSRALELTNNADLVVLVFDGSEPLTEQDFHLYEMTREKAKILALNKIDLNVMLKESELLSDAIKISAKTGDNTCLLVRRIGESLCPKASDSSVFLTRKRHIQALENVKKCLLNIQQVSDPEAETIAFELHEALDILGELTGNVTRKEILDKIFDEFCIGK